MRDENGVDLAQHDRPLEGKPFPPSRLHPRLYFAEFAGTALLVAVGLSIVILMFGVESPLVAIFPSNGLRRFLTGALFGSVGALIAISHLGRISGAHLNPSVTLAFWLEGKLSWRDALLYVAAQCAGAIAGSVPLLMWGQLGQSVAFGTTEPGIGVPVWAALLGETIVTFLLIVTIFTTASNPRTRRFTPLTIPVLFSLLVWLEAPISGTSTNAARSLGPAIIVSISAHQWIYLIGPAAGAMLAVALFRIERIGLQRVSVARLFHFRE